MPVIEGFPVEADRGQHTGREVLDHHVTPSGEVAGDLGTLRAENVERDRPLVRVEVEEERRLLRMLVVACVWPSYLVALPLRCSTLMTSAP